MKGFYSPIDQLAAQLPRTKGTGAEFMTELSKRPGYKPQEAQDRELQTLMALPKMERAQFLEALKAKPPVIPKVVENYGTDDPRYLTPEERKYGGNEGQAFHEEYTLPGGENYREILLKHPKGNFAGVGAHFGGEPNILASVRAKDRKGPNGEKILHIEEIQSDWHQQGRDKGYLPPDMPKQIAAAKLAHRRLKEQLEEAKAGSDFAERGLSSDQPLYQDPVMRQRLEAAKVKHNNKIMDLMPQVMKAEAAHQDLEQKAQRGAPDAPFKKNWHELALKKMIHHAAEKGYDAIAITPGEEQAKRYKLSKRVGTVAYHPETQHFQAFAPNRETIINEKGVTPERVSELVGKDVAKRLMQAPQTMGHHTLEGEDLNVGGEGMKGFYDKMIPSFLNQFGKKYGAQVGTVNIKTAGSDTPVTGGEIAEAMGYPFREFVNLPNRAQLEKQYWENQKNKTTPVHHFPITPEMREDVVKNGVPLYADGGSVEGEEPKKTVKAYKLFRVHPKHPGKLFPLFVDANTPVEMNKWIDAKEGEMANGKVKSKIGPLAYRPGWHAGDLPIATHIGEKSDPALTAPDVRPENHAWAEVEMPDDVDWQAEATKRGTNAQGKLIPVKAHITDQIPKGGHYRYKTNPNMTGNWLIGGSMKVNRVLNDKEVAKINKAAGLADLPRAQPFKAKKFGFAGGGTVGPEEWMAEEHVNHKAKGGSDYPLKDTDKPLKHVSPTSYLSKVSALPMNAHDRKKIEQLKREMHADKKLEPLMIMANGAADGRHRAHAAKELGIKKVPVVDDEHVLAKGGSVMGINVRSDKKANLQYADLIVDGYKTYESRNGDTLRPYVGKRVSIVRTGDGPAKAIGAVTVGEPLVVDRKKFREMEQHHLVPEGSTFDITSGTKHLYPMHDPERYESERDVGHGIVARKVHMAKGGAIKPVGYTKEKVTVSPNLDAMRYELMSVKHYVKKVK